MILALSLVLTPLAAGALMVYAHGGLTWQKVLGLLAWMAFLGVLLNSACGPQPMQRPHPLLASQGPGQE